MSPAKKHAAVWLAFSAGMYAESVAHAGKFTDEQIDPDDARTMFRVACGEALEALGVEHEEIAPIFDKGLAFMTELRAKDAGAIPVEEDSPPLMLTPKPDGHLS